MVCIINKYTGQSIEAREGSTEVKIIGCLEQSDFDYIRESDISYLDLSEAFIHAIGNSNCDSNARFENSFSDCKNLESIILPDMLRTIINWAFCNCKSLKYINIPEEVTYIGVFAFSGCLSLNCLEIPKNVHFIGEWAFSGCNSLSFLRIPEGIDNVRNYTFYNCISLSSVSIPSSVTAIGNWAFCGCLSLRSLSIDTEKLTFVGMFAFADCRSLDNYMHMPKIEIIGNHAFANCRIKPKLEGLMLLNEFSYYHRVPSLFQSDYNYKLGSKNSNGNNNA